MIMSGILRKAYRDITRRKVRLALTVLGVLIGVAGIVTIISTSQNLTRAQAQAFSNSSQADVTLWVGDAPPSLERALEAIPNVAEAELRTTYWTKWKVGEVWRDIYFIGIADFGGMKVNRITLKEGRYPAWDECLLGVSVKEIVPVAVRQEITYRAGSDNAEHYLTVSGFAQSPTYLSSVLTNLSIAYAPAVTVGKMVGITGSNQVLVKVSDFSTVAETVEEIERTIAKRGLSYGKPQVRDPRDYPGRRELDALILLMFLFSALGIILSGFLVANTLSAIITEGVREIGIMKALGASRGQVMRLYLLTTLFYGLAGTILGLLIGSGNQWFLTAYIGHLASVEVPFRPSPQGLFLGTLVGLGVTLLAGLGPAWIGTSITVGEALTGYGITSTYGQGLLDRALHRVRGLPSLAAMALRNLARRKARNVVTLAVIALSTAAYLAAQSTYVSVSQAIEGIFDIYSPDAWIYFNEPVDSHFGAMLLTMPGVRDVEPWSLDDCWVGYAKARLWGLPADTTLYRYQLEAGRWYREGETDAMVISADLAAARDLRLGDVVEVQVGDAARSFRVVGVADDYSIFLGSTVTAKVFLPVDVTDRMLGRLGRASFFALQLDDSTPEGVNRILGRLERKFRRWRPGTVAAHREFKIALEQSKILAIGLGVMVTIVALISAVGVVNTLTLSVLERRREIGVLRAVGANDWRLFQVFLTEGLILGLVGWVLGTVVGYPAGRFFVGRMGRLLFQLKFVFTPRLVLTGLLFAILLVVLASIGPALGAARLPVAETLRYE
jgi:putative ABC transport system permease protein